VPPVPLGKGTGGEPTSYMEETSAAHHRPAEGWRASTSASHRASSPTLAAGPGRTLPPVPPRKSDTGCVGSRHSGTLGLAAEKDRALAAGS
jgi:hypothetical protein